MKRRRVTVSVSYGTSVYLHADYEFSESRQAAYQWCARRVTPSIEKMAKNAGGRSNKNKTDRSIRELYGE